MRRYRNGLLAVFTAVLLTAPFHAGAVPYASFDQSENHPALPAPASYAPERILDGAELGGGAWNEPQDMTFDAQGNLYLLDTNNNRILIYDGGLRFVREISKLSGADGKEESFNHPQSVFVSGQGRIYIADTNNERCLKLDQTGKILQEYRRPVSEAYTSEVYNPVKVIADPGGMVYVISQNVYQGVILYSDAGEFQGYFGSPPVVVSAKLLIDRFWKSVLSREMREGISNYVPVEYTSFDIDAEGFIYTVSVYTDDDMQQIRRLNYLGNNILENRGNMGEREIAYYQRERWYSKFSDICAADGGMLAIDSQFQRIYLFDLRGNRLLTFGTAGEQQGAFQRASAIESRDGAVYVLDSLKNTITIFRPTPYGQLIRDAARHDGNGDYDEAAVCWKRVLAQNANNEMAYAGIGEAKLKNGDYAGAVHSFRLAGNRERESVAFGYYRSEWLRKHMGLGMAFFLIAVAAAAVFTNRRLWEWIARVRRAHEKPARAGKLLRLTGRVITHPLETFTELKHKRYQSLPLIGLVLAAWTLVNVLSRQFTGFRFNTYDTDLFSLPVQIATTVIPFVLICAANWAVCAILNGEGKFWEICTYLAFAAVPFILCSAAALLLTRFMVLDESVFIAAVRWIGILWSLMLVFQGQRMVHNYSTGKTLGTAALTLVGTAAILIILLLLFTLILQVTNFISSIYSELSFRK